MNKTKRNIIARQARLCNRMISHVVPPPRDIEKEIKAVYYECGMGLVHGANLARRLPESQRARLARAMLHEAKHMIQPAAVKEQPNMWGNFYEPKAMMLCAVNPYFFENMAQTHSWGKNALTAMMFFYP